WIEGDFGPRQTSARGRRGTVSATCSSCGFLSLLAGSLRGQFGVCTNEWSPADGRVGHLRYGCGAHSETGKEEAPAPSQRNGNVVVDELDVEFQKPAEGESTPTGETSSTGDESSTGEESSSGEGSSTDEESSTGEGSSTDEESS